MSLIPARNYIFFDSKDAIGTSAEGMTIWDRAISAEQYARYNEAMFTSGVNPHEGEVFEVVAGNGLKIVRKSGHAMLGGRSIHDAEQREFTVLAGNTYYYMMESNTEVEYRCVREGVILASEVTFPLLRDINHYQIILAKIEIPAGAVQVAENMITDYRYNPDYCGLLSLNANINVKQVVVTADDVKDTDKAFISKIGGRTKVVKGDGETGNLADVDITDKLRLIDDNGEMAIINTDGRDVYHRTAAAVSYQQFSGNVISFPTNMLTDVYSTTNASVSVTQSAPFDIVYTFANLTFRETAHDILIRVRFKASATTPANLTARMWLRNMTTNTDIAATETPITLITGNGGGIIAEIKLSYAELAQLLTSSLGLHVNVLSSTSSATAFYIHGVDVKYEYKETTEVVRYDGAGLYMGGYRFIYDKDDSKTKIRANGYVSPRESRTPSSSRVISGMPVNPANMLNDITNDTYTQFSYVPATNPAKFVLMFDMPAIPRRAKNVRIVVELKKQGNTTNTIYRPSLYLYNTLTNTHFSNTQQQITMATTADVSSHTYYYDNISALADSDIQLAVYIDGTNTTAGSFILSVYGCKISAEYELEAHDILTIDEAGTITMNNTFAVDAQNTVILNDSYTMRKNGDNTDILMRNSFQSGQLSAASAQNLSTGGISAPVSHPFSNALNSADNAEPALISRGTTSTENDYFQAIYNYNAAIQPGATTCDVILRFRAFGVNFDPTTSGNLDMIVALVNGDTGADIPGAVYYLKTKTSIQTITHHFDNISSLGVSKIGMRLRFTPPIYGEGQVQLYGSDITVSQYVNNAVIGKFTPTGIVSSGMQGASYELLLEAIEEGLS